MLGLGVMGGQPIELGGTLTFQDLKEDWVQVTPCLVHRRGLGAAIRSLR